MQIIQEGAVIPEWTLGDRLRKAREHAGFSQTELGREIGVSLSSVSRYEIDRYPVPKAVLLAWAICTNCDFDWLLGQGRINVRYLGSPACGLLVSDRARLGLAA